ncbi:MAG: hypothetical protein JWQ35_899 [Bacteriovoracaceae bacterium]|nr:hypothetical protein [Bacteriovoracaceae bacterium]
MKRKGVKAISLSSYRNVKFLVRVEWQTKDDFLQKWYECKKKDEALRLIKELNDAFDHPRIWLYREVPIEE